MEVSNIQSLEWQVKGKRWCLSLLVFKFYIVRRKSR